MVHARHVIWRARVQFQPVLFGFLSCYQLSAVSMAEKCQLERKRHAFEAGRKHRTRALGLTNMCTHEGPYMKGLMRTHARSFNTLLTVNKKDLEQELQRNSSESCCDNVQCQHIARVLGKTTAAMLPPAIFLTLTYFIKWPRKYVSKDRFAFSMGYVVSSSFQSWSWSSGPATANRSDSFEVYFACLR